jgi:hypothetical protein
MADSSLCTREPEKVDSAAGNCRRCGFLEHVCAERALQKADKNGVFLN